MSPKYNYWFCVGISFILIAIIFSLKMVKEFFVNVPDELNADIFLTIASISGTIFAIFFSMILMTVQHASTNYLPSILKTFKKDTRSKFIVILSFFTIVINLFFYLYGNPNLINIAMFTFCISFLSIVLYYYEVLNFINPSFIVENIENNILTQMEKNIKRLNKTVKNNAKETSLKKFSGLLYYTKLNSADYFNANIKLIDELFNHIERSEVINDPETHIKSLNSLSNVVEFYLSTKRVDLQEDAFIEYVLTKLKLQTDFLINKNEHFKILEIVKTLEKFALASINNLNTVHFADLNYTAMIISSHIEKIGMKSVQTKNLDISKECILSLKKIGFLSINKNLNLNMTEEGIKKIAISSDNWFIYNHSIGSINLLLNHIIECMPKKQNVRKIIPESDIGNLINVQGELLKSAIIKYGGYLQESAAISPMFGPLSNVKLSKIIEKIIWLSNTPPVQMATHNYETVSKKFIRKILNNQSQIIDVAKRRKSNIILMNYTTEFLEVTEGLNKTKLKTYEKGFDEEILLLNELILKCYRDCHTRILLIGEIKEFLDKLEQNKTENKEIIEQLRDILNLLEKEKNEK